MESLDVWPIKLFNKKQLASLSGFKKYDGGNLENGNLEIFKILKHKRSLLNPHTFEKAPILFDYF